MNLAVPTDEEIMQADELARRASAAMGAAPAMVALLASGQIFASIAISVGSDLNGFMISATSIYNALAERRAHMHMTRTKNTREDVN